MKFVLQLLESEINRYQRSIEALAAILKATNDKRYQSAIIRDQEYLFQFEKAREILLNSEQEDERSVATGLPKEQNDGPIKDI